MRLKRNQGEIQRYCRDLLRIMLEVAASKFSEQTWVEMTGLPYATEQELMQAQMVLQASQQQAMQYQGQPLPPQVQQAMQQAQQVLQKPQWSQVLELLKNDMQRSYQIDIETNSTVLPEAIEDQKNIADVMTALGQYLQGVTPLIQEGAFPFEAAKAMMIAVVRRYQFGEEIEKYINEMKPPAPPQQPQDNSLQVKQLELQASQASEQSSAQLEQMKLEMSRMIEEGKAKTQMHIEKMRNESAKEIEAMRIESAERVAMFQAEMDRETRLAIANMQVQADVAKKDADMVDAEQWRQHEANEADKQKIVDYLQAEGQDNAGDD